ncbi:GGDEF domain-containing protein [Aminipila terrae]|uniref:Diguanylate cyclase n=1 Tax=Aminipila terrae TaxID=2697030 RepID=A0A6P1MIJ3_9FIRM|nr:GGDEF domain-containing protein [Aminipila terrae]QHI73561.1 diguanylate cyclase [Aminipila terrae]
MLLYALLSGYFQIKKVKKITVLHKIYEISFGGFGFAVAISRALLLQNSVFAIPTIYIAVIYGFAVFFYFSPVISLCMYSITCISITVLFPVFHHDLVQLTFAQDILSNNIIAWIACVINYQRYAKEYESQRMICDKNERLQAKTSKIEKTNQVLQYISNVDALTNIYNRRKLNEILETEYDRCKMLSKNIALILMDVDLFKSINDTYGHNDGDRVLAQLGQILKNNVGKSDKVGRWGGEEFLIICPETDIEDAFNLAERIRKIIQNSEFRLGRNITCSFGVTEKKEPDTINDLMLRADKGLYKAKEGGRNRVEQEK